MKKVIYQAKKVKAKPKKKAAKKSTRMLPLVLLAIILLLLPILIYQILFFDKISPGIYIAGINVGGLTRTGATEVLVQRTRMPQKLQLTFKGKIFNLDAKGVGFDFSKSVDEAFRLTRSDNLILDYSKRFSLLSIQENIQPSINFSDSLETSLEKTFSQIEELMQNPKFTFDGKKVTQFQPGKDGLAVDRTKLNQQIFDSFSKHSADDVSIEIPVNKISPDVTTDKTNDLGIKELIGTGSSTYYHSIPGRVYNVVLAASRINGTLIAPGETFSFNNTLGDVSAFTGYQQAYIISGGKTILGDGGGVCQVSTTLFRAILNAGLPVVERAAHAYRVGYYEQNSPPGLDATVYGPSPDLKFTNDTPSYILIEAAANAKTYSLVFDLYGTSDGRVSTISKPVVSNYQPALPTVYQDDPTLAAGTLKQTDFSAAGATVTFNYLVKRNGETIYQKTFVSNYRPWAAVYLRGTKI